MTVLKVLGCVVGFLGVVVINLANGGFDMSIKLSGEGAILLSAAAYALSSGMIKKYSKDFQIYSCIYRTSYIYGDDFSCSIYFVGNIA